MIDIGKILYRQLQLEEWSNAETISRQDSNDLALEFLTFERQDPEGLHMPRAADLVRQRRTRLSTFELDTTAL